MKIRFFLVLFSIGCNKNLSVPESQVHGSKTPSALEITHNVLESVIGDYSIGDQASIDRLSKFNDLQRAFITITADNSATKYPRKASIPPMHPIKIPYVVSNHENMVVIRETQSYNKYKENGKIYYDSNLKATYEKMADKFSFVINKDNECKRIIPFHPQTGETPYFVTSALVENVPYEFDFIAFNSMSRSLFVLNVDYEKNELPALFSIKMGTTYVAGAFNPYQYHKLNGIHEEVSMVNHFSATTSISDLMLQHDIVGLSDSAGIDFTDTPNDSLNKYHHLGIILRDYSQILLDRDRIYMPLAKFFSLKKEQTTNRLYWSLYKEGEKELRLFVTNEDLVKFARTLAIQNGKLMAIYYFNGYTSRDMHEQNLMVGIPLKRNLDAKLAVRDLSDHWTLGALGGGLDSSMQPISLHHWDYIEMDLPDVDPEASALLGFEEIANQLRPYLKFTTANSKFEPKSTYKKLVIRHPEDQEVIQSIENIRSLQILKATKKPLGNIRARIPPKCLNSIGSCIGNGRRFAIP